MYEQPGEGNFPSPGSIGVRKRWQDKIAFLIHTPFWHSASAIERALAM